MGRAKILLITALLGTFAVGASIAFHGSELVCRTCHTIHYSEDGGTPPGADSGGPFPNLITKDGSSMLCLVCHENGDNGAPDVVGTDTNGLNDQRAAGSFAGEGVVSATGHNLGAGKTPDLCDTCHYDLNDQDFNTLTVGCVDCHDPHGKPVNSADYSYRNLAINSHKFGTVNAYYGPPYPQIKAFVDPTATGFEVYRQSRIGYIAPDTQTPDTDWREVTNVCLHCHIRFSGHSDALDYYETREGDVFDGVCVRHPSSESIRGAWEAVDGPLGSTDKVHWKNGLGIGFSIPRLPFLVSGSLTDSEFDYDFAKAEAYTNKVFCLTCHKAHGSLTNNSSLRWDNKTLGVGCQQCHNKG